MEIVPVNSQYPYSVRYSKVFSLTDNDIHSLPDLESQSPTKDRFSQASNYLKKIVSLAPSNSITPSLYLKSLTLTVRTQDSSCLVSFLQLCVCVRVCGFGSEELKGHWLEFPRVIYLSFTTGLYHTVSIVLFHFGPTSTQWHFDTGEHRPRIHVDSIIEVIETPTVESSDTLQSLDPIESVYIIGSWAANHSSLSKTYCHRAFLPDLEKIKILDHGRGQIHYPHTLGTLPYLEPSLEPSYKNPKIAVGPLRSSEENCTKIAAVVAFHPPLCFCSSCPK